MNMDNLMAPAIMETAVEAELLLHEIRSLIQDARSHVAQAVNQELTALYWRTGERVRREILGHERADYRQQVMESLTTLYGKGYSRTSLFRMVQFAERFPDYSIVASLSRQLSWTHWVQMIGIEDALKRDFYAPMCRVERWSVRALQSEIKGMRFERTALRDQDRMTPDLVFQDLIRNKDRHLMPKTFIAWLYAISLVAICLAAAPARADEDAGAAVKQSFAAIGSVHSYRFTTSFHNAASGGNDVYSQGESTQSPQLTRNVITIGPGNSSPAI